MPAGPYRQHRGPGCDRCPTPVGRGLRGLRLHFTDRPVLSDALTALAVGADVRGSGAARRSPAAAAVGVPVPGHEVSTTGSRWRERWVGPCEGAVTNDRGDVGAPPTDTPRTDRRRHCAGGCSRSSPARGRSAATTRGPMRASTSSRSLRIAVLRSACSGRGERASRAHGGPAPPRPRGTGPARLCDPSGGGVLNESSGAGTAVRPCLGLGLEVRAKLRLLWCLITG